MNKIIITLDLSKEAVLLYYKGQAQSVIATSLDGRKIKFPASILRQVIKPEGVNGMFEIEYDDKGKFQTIRPIHS